VVASELHKFKQIKREGIILAYKILRREKTFYHESAQSPQRKILRVKDMSNSYNKEILTVGIPA
jgi:hypothetical protein